MRALPTGDSAAVAKLSVMQSTGDKRRPQVLVASVRGGRSRQSSRRAAGSCPEYFVVRLRDGHCASHMQHSFAIDGSPVASALSACSCKVAALQHATWQRGWGPGWGASG